MKRTITFSAIFAASALNLFSYNAKVTCIYTDGHREVKDVALRQQGSVQSFFWKKENIPADIKYIKILPEFATARTGEKGYFVMPNGELGKFHEKKGKHSARNYMPMPIFGMKNTQATFVAIVTGMPYEYRLITEAENGVYTMITRFELMGQPAYDNIAIDYHMLSGDQADYSGMARVYREYQIKRKACIPLKERMKGNPELTYAASCMSIRIRQGWKPSPSPIKQQTRYNEPPMKAAVTFDRAGDILDEFKRQGIDRAEICLVGWNRKGHDGRFPELFPVEEQLGGEKKLRELIKKAQSMGFQIVCHNNSYDAYQIAKNWDGEYIIKNPDGSMYSHAVYSGGRMYNICPQRAFERFAQKELRQIADLGFRGLHYNDVLTVVQPRACYDPRHPLNRNQSAKWIGKIMAEAQKNFGGSASEGGHDFCCGNLDYALYASIKPPREHPMIDRFVPFWQLVYHGIILSNPFPPTCNYTIKDKKTQLMLNEFGGRPFFYFYSNYRDNGKAWMGVKDITCEDDQALKASVARIKEGYDEFNSRARLQTEFMNTHEQIDKDIYRVVYSNGSEMICNYRKTSYDYKGDTIEPLAYILKE
ncbi:MAG: DUF5696 domain-containing protein [Kiritimatiellia bacterium]